MNICHFSTQPGFRGGERQLLRIHEGLLRNGENSTILYREGNPVFSGLDNTIHLSLNGVCILTLFIRLQKLLKQIHPDLIHCHDSKAMTLVALCAPFIKIPVVVSRKTVYPLSNSWMTSMKYRSVKQVIAVSRAAALIVQNRFPTLPVSVIHDGVLPEVEFSREESRKRLGIDMSRQVFASVGYFSSEKNVPLLRATADLLSKLNPRATLLLVGPVPERFQPLVENHPSIVCLGKIDDAEKYYAGFDFYLSTSTREGLGSALLDAVIRGIPVISLNSGGSEDILGLNDLDHCNTDEHFLSRVAYYCAHDVDTISVQKRKTLSEELFSVNQLVQNHIDLYRSLLTNEFQIG